MRDEVSKNMKRMLYRAQIKACGKKELTQEKLMTCIPDLNLLIQKEKIMKISAHRLGDFLFIYYETIDEVIPPDQLFGSLESELLPWPGMEYERYFIPMIEIFHYNKPLNNEHWERKQKEFAPYVRIAYIKPDMMASYIYYHFQFQEEKPGGGDKYGIIGMHENLLCFYMEKPFTIEEPSYKGALKTHNTPENWKGAMIPHFIGWTDAPPGQELWKETENLISL